MFFECEFPRTISYKAQGGPSFNTTVNSGFSGFEQRNQNWETARGYWTVSLATPGSNVDPQVYIDMLISFFLNVAGKSNAFRLKDHKDFTNGLTAQPLGLGDGVTGHFQLVKNYTSGNRTYQRVITKPMTSLVIDYLGNPLNDTVSVSSGSGLYPTRPGYVMGSTAKYSVDETTGFVSFGNAAVLTVTKFDFDAADGNARLYYTAVGGATPLKNEQVFFSGLTTTSLNGTFNIIEVGAGWVKIPVQILTSGNDSGTGVIGWASLVLDNVVSVAGSAVTYHYSSLIGLNPVVGQRFNVSGMQTGANGSYYISAVNLGSSQVTVTNTNVPATGAHAGIATTDWVPPSGAGLLSATYQYHYAVRLDTDELMIQLEESNVEGGQPIVTWNAIVLREVRMLPGDSQG